MSQPDRPRGRGKRLSPSPVSAVAEREGLPLLRPERVGETEVVEALRAWAPDLGVVVAFGQFLPKKLRELPSCGYLINAHASLLPRLRGAAPIARAILDGERETGISVMRIEREMDAGPVASLHRIPIGEQENTEELSGRLATLAAEAIEGVVDAIADERVVWTEQDASRATEAPKLEKHDARLDLREPAEALVRRVHALSPRPGGSLRLRTDAGEETLKVSRAEAIAFEADERPAPGELRLGAPPGTLRVATGSGWLAPLVLQRAGGRPLPVEEFLRGYALPDGARFGLPSDEKPAEAR